MMETLGHASAIAVPDARSHRHLIAYGIRDDRIRRLPDISRLQIDRHPQHIRSIRHALGRINQELMVPSGHRLIVAWSDFLDIAEEKRVTRAVGELVNRRYPLRMWWLGNGPKAAAFYRWIKDEGWQYEILLPGVLDHPEDLLTAADLVLFAGGPGRWPALWREAMASAVPWMADNQFNMALDSPAAESCFFSEQSLGERLRQWLEDPVSHQQQVDACARELRSRDADGWIDQQWRQLLME
jgi:glycosyltransferase involved in cell wall biosynthesis